MYKSKNDVPVFLIFFNRPDTFSKVFEAVKTARPSKLFLVCDAAREDKPGEEDLVNQCKAIAENIDWECEVYKNFADSNMGCGNRMSSGLDWAFSFVDRLIILEDDCVPGQDFFPFCEELLERYKDDCRICMIDAMNKLGVYEECPYDYFFGQGCCWGWATWRRVWQQMDYKMSFLNDSYAVRCVESTYPYYGNSGEFGRMMRDKLARNGRLSSWTYQMGMSTALQGQVCIVPKKNLISNIGLTGDSGHAVDDINKLAVSTQGLFNTPIYSLSFPLKHPQYVVEDRMYWELCEKQFGDTPARKIEALVRRFRYSSSKERADLIKKIPGKLRDLISRD